MWVLVVNCHKFGTISSPQSCRIDVPGCLCGLGLLIQRPWWVLGGFVQQEPDMYSFQEKTLKIGHCGRNRE